jgi:tetratricopeptide (TPR) repeat protein
MPSSYMPDPEPKPPQDRSRKGAVPPMPTAREPHLLLDEVSGTLGFALWRVLTDCTLWLDSDQAPDLFWSESPWRADLPHIAAAPEVMRALETLSRVSTGALGRKTLANASAVIWEWAEKREFRQTALAFAELAARFEPYSSERASTAGRLCRPVREFVRGTRWYRGAARLARLAGRDREFAIAHLGWGNLEGELGNLGAAEFHATKAFRAALRVGRHSLAASAYHDLMTVKIHTHRLEEAWQHARDALALYRTDHPRFPALLHDIAYLWSMMGLFSSALVIYVRVLAMMSRRRERITVQANIARAAAAAHDRVYYVRAKTEVIQAVESEGADFVPVSALYHLARACQTYEEWNLAERLASLVVERSSGRWLARAQALEASLAAREAGDVDALPAEGSEVDQVREALLRRLSKHGAEGDDEAMPPERYPIT